MTRHRLIGVPEQSFAILSRYASGSQTTPKRMSQVVNAN